MDSADRPVLHDQRQLVCGIAAGVQQDAAEFTGDAFIERLRQPETLRADGGHHIIADADAGSGGAGGVAHGEVEPGLFPENLQLSPDVPDVSVDHLVQRFHHRGGIVQQSQEEAAAVAHAAEGFQRSLRGMDVDRNPSGGLLPEQAERLKHHLRIAVFFLRPELRHRGDLLLGHQERRSDVKFIFPDAFAAESFCQDVGSGVQKQDRNVIVLNLREQQNVLQFQFQQPASLLRGFDGIVHDAVDAAAAVEHCRRL